MADSQPRIKRQLESLLKKEGKVPSVVDCVIFKSREDAKHWISINHSGPQDGKGQISWNAEQKERFSGGLSIGIQALDLLSSKTLINNDDKGQINKTTLDRVLEYKKVREKLSITKNGEHFIFGNIDSLKQVTLALKNLRVDAVYTAQKGIDFVERALELKLGDETFKHAVGSGAEFDDGSSPASKERSDEATGLETDREKEAENISNRRVRNDSASSRSRRSPTQRLTVFGGSLSLKLGHINNLYRDIEEIYLLYKNGRVKFSDDFIVIFRMSLRMLAETAANEKGKDLATYLREYFDEAKELSQKMKKRRCQVRASTRGKLLSFFKQELTITLAQEMRNRL